MLFKSFEKIHFLNYGKCPKISYTNVSDKVAYANSADPDLTAPSSLIRVYTVCHSTEYLKKQLHKKQNLGQKSTDYSIKDFRTFTIGIVYYGSIVKDKRLVKSIFYKFLYQ